MGPRDTIELRWNRPEDADAILAFIAEMGFTQRDRTTWDALGMCAVIATHQDLIVGAIPLEVRPVKISPDVTISWAHQTCVAVAPHLRGGGIGSRLQSMLRTALPSHAHMLGVFREDPDSPAYRWYLANGFTRAMQMQSWSLSLPDAANEPCPSSHDEGAIDDFRQLELWTAARGNGVVVDQRERRLRPWLEAHPYRSRYRFEIVSLDERAYTVLGIGRLHSDQDRADILDFIAPDARDAAPLLKRCRDVAARQGASPLRWALATNDPLCIVAGSIGMTPGWSFDLLIRPVDESLHYDTTSWRYAGIDFV